MSESAAKANRREIRRAFGEQAIGAIDSHAQSIGDIIRVVETLKQQLAHETHMRVQHVEIESKRIDPHDAFLRRGFWSRLNWLVTGR